MKNASVTFFKISWTIIIDVFFFLKVRLYLPTAASTETQQVVGRAGWRRLTTDLTKLSRTTTRPTTLLLRPYIPGSLETTAAAAAATHANDMAPADTLVGRTMQTAGISWDWRRAATDETSPRRRRRLKNTVRQGRHADRLTTAAAFISLISSHLIAATVNWVA